MTQELGKMERPSTGSFHGKRKLFLVPRLYEPPSKEEDGLAILRRYWEQVRSQVASLESGLGPAKHIYHENVTVGGEQGLKRLEAFDKHSHPFIQARCQGGAILEATEDEAILEETLDLQRCLMMPFASSKVPARLHEWFSDSVRRRFEHISRRIDTTLGEEEVGLLVINERHQVQFPSGMEVFYVAPPALDEYHRWLDGWIARQQAAYAEAEQAADSSDEPEAEQAG